MGDEGEEEVEPPLTVAQVRFRRRSETMKETVFFRNEVREKIALLEDGNVEEFPPSLTELQRGIVQEVAKELDVFAFIEGAGAARHITVFSARRMSRQIRQELEAIPPNDFKVYPAPVPKFTRQVIMSIASELKLSPALPKSPVGTSIEVYNVGDFAEEVRAILAGLRDGEEHAFPRGCTATQQRIVRSLAADLGFMHQVQEYRGSNRLCIGNKRAFSELVRAELALLPPGGCRAYSSRLTLLDRKAVKQVAEASSMLAEEVSAATETHIQVMSAAADAVPTSIVNESAHAEQKVISAIFEQYSTGTFGEEKCFTRFTDLGAFCEDIAPILKKSKQGDETARLDSIFEDTLQLQFDFGCRCKGLLRPFFKAFVEKAALILGWPLVVFVSTMEQG
eukprot:NODE_530_length_1496_cov_199.516308.p1 GENE.NODE_530_length_1496_cov_199.516308~~NODE_530_length_1496_cov_199.516308.p1  ORF type:complete len:394 (+),score=125.96 NODE_530_length_1496_cov_199.516308:3-1184(+)